MIQHKPVVVILVDHKIRDLPVAVLIAFHLEQLGMEVHLEPLESYKGVLAAFRPDPIIFHHLLASHLVEYSKRLHKMGVLVAVLFSEGLTYGKEMRLFSAGRNHGAHIDLFFCWNEPIKEAMREVGADSSTRIEVVGPPRMDFYFPPWSGTNGAEGGSRRSRPKILLATNLGLAPYKELPPVEADKLFDIWSKRIASYKDYWGAIEVQYRSRSRVLDYMRQLLESDRYDVVLRPHPREGHEYYHDWVESLPVALQRSIVVDGTSKISELIIDCDLEISLDTCTTALEPWIAVVP